MMSKDFEMREDVREQVLACLNSEFSFRKRGDWLRQGACPSCGKKELYIDANNPWMLKCGRLNRCGFEDRTKERYPECFENFEKRFPATTQSPNATADAFMGMSRGLKVRQLKGFYRQGQFSHPYGNKETATVVFDIDKDAGIFMERFVSKVTIRQKDGSFKDRNQNIEGSFRGRWWFPDNVPIEDGDEIWLSEACIDSCSIYLAGKKSAALLSCSNFPELELEKLKDRDIKLVFALDNDKAGQKYTRIFVKKAQEMGFDARAALIPQKGRKKSDWNDEWMAGRLTGDNWDDFLYYGDLLLAKSPMEKGMLIWQKSRSQQFSLEYDKRTYWFSIPQEEFNKFLTEAMKPDSNMRAELVRKLDELFPEGDFSDADEDKVLTELVAKKAAQILQIANCTFKFLYFQQNEQTDESWYYTRVEFPHGRHTIKNTFSGGQVAAGSEFKKRLLSIAPGALYTGNGQHLNWVVQHHLDNIRIVDTIDFIGYSKEHNAFVTHDRAYSGGKVYPVNDEDFFEIGKQSLKSLNGSLQLQIGEAGDYDKNWLHLLHQAYGPKGVIAAAFFLGSLYSEQIRKEWKSWPFLEIVGEAGAGKTTLIEFLWKLVGRTDYEGFDPNKSTLAARARIFSQVSNLPICLIESDREDSAKAKQFDWDELKTAFNGRASRARGVKNSGNETIEPPFRGSIIISQNTPVNASEPIMQRIVHTFFDTSNHTADSKVAADAMAAMPVENLSHFLTLAMTRESEILELIKTRVAGYEVRLLEQDGLRSNRIAKNHAQIMAMVDGLSLLTDMPKEMRKDVLKELKDASLERQQAISADHPIIEEFWESYEFLGDYRLNHYGRDADEIAVNLNHMQQQAHSNGQLMVNPSDLKKHLRSSKSRLFKDYRAVKSKASGFEDRTVKCWIFKREKGAG